MRKVTLSLALLFCSLYLLAQTPITQADYQAASRFSPTKVNKMVFSTNVDPHWLKKLNRFWYTYETPDNKQWWIVDPAKAQKKLMFDNTELAARLTRIVKDPMDAQNLNIDSLRFIKDENWIQFEVKSTEEIEKKDTTKAAGDTTARKRNASSKERKTFYFEYNINTRELVELNDFTKPKRKPGWANISPDGQTIIFSKKHNLYWMDKANYEKALKNEEDSTIVEHQITTDGEENFGYGGGRGENNVEKEKNKDKRKSAFILWSPDSQKFIMTRTDERHVKDLWVINSIASPRPTLETYKYQMPGEKENPIRYLLLFDVATKTQKELDVKLFKDQEIGLWSAPQMQSTRDDDWRPSVWHGTNAKVYFYRTSRDLKRIDVCVVEIPSGEVKTLIEERMNTYVEIRRPGLVNGGKELIHWSEQDGWAHFYLYDENGKLKNQITSGGWHSEDIESIDEKKRVLYFTANGREEGEDPYLLHLYRVNFDGSGLRLLNPGAFENSVSIDDNSLYFVNNSSTVHSAPKSALYNTEGRKILDLENADLSSLFGAGYKYPEVFKVKANDGRTDLYGVMYKPYDFDSTKKYPIIAYVYPGPQTEAVNKAWGRSMDRTDRLAQAGFIVITVGNRGGHPSRSKWYHNFGYGNLRDYGLADKKAAIEQLANRHDFIDINRVGIHGHSGGGFMSAAALMVYPDFFKVAVSNAGNHDNAIYNRWWSEKHHGVKEVISDKGDTTFVYAIENNQDLAKNLKGKLLLTHGDIDNNVHPANTLRVANALMHANKRFDMIILPGQRHGYGNLSEYWFWRMVDYFSEHLLGDKHDEVDILEMNREVELNNKKR